MDYGGCKALHQQMCHLQLHSEETANGDTHPHQIPPLPWSKVRMDSHSAKTTTSSLWIITLTIGSWTSWLTPSATIIECCKGQLSKHSMASLLSPPPPLFPEWISLNVLMSKSLDTWYHHLATRCCQSIGGAALTCSWVMYSIVPVSQVRHCLLCTDEEHANQWC